MNVDPEHATIGLLIIVSCSLIAWDAFVAFFNDVPNERDTISGIMLRTGQRLAGLPFAFGALTGHLFLPQGAIRILPMPWAAGALAILAGLASLSGYLIRERWPKFPVTWPALGLGLAAGCLLWPQ